MGVARVEGIGPVIASQLSLLLAGTKVTVRPVIDTDNVAPVDSYEIPDRIRLAVTTRTPHDAFPFGTRTATGCDLDHVEAYRYADPAHTQPATRAQTRVNNLTPLSRRAHRAKTLGIWHYDLLPDGTHLWTSPLQRTYIVAPNGTTQPMSPLDLRLARLLARAA